MARIKRSNASNRLERVESLRADQPNREFESLSKVSEFREL